MNIKEVPIEISARHIHLAESDFQVLFGSGAELSPKKNLSQKGEFASQYRLTIKNEEREIKNVRVLGPFRDQTQVEISRTDAFYLKADVPLRLSGNLEGSAPVKLIGPDGVEVELPEGMIVAKRHLHVSPAQAQELGIIDDQQVSVRVGGERSGQLDNCIVRVKANFEASFHLDTDEANALAIKPGQTGELIIAKA